MCKFHEEHLTNGGEPCKFSAEKCKFFHRKIYKGGGAPTPSCGGTGAPAPICVPARQSIHAGRGGGRGRRGVQGGRGGGRGGGCGGGRGGGRGGGCGSGYKPSDIVETKEMSIDDIISHSKYTVMKDVVDKVSKDNFIYYSVLSESKRSLTKMVKMINVNFKDPKHHETTLITVLGSLREILSQFPEDVI